MDIDNIQKRTVLKACSAATIGVIGGGGLFSGVVAGSSEVEITDSSWADYEPWQKDQRRVCGDSGCLEPSSSIYIQNPGTVGFDLCTDTSAGEICASMGDTLTANTYECANGSELQTVPVTITEFEDGSASWTQEIWIGLDTSGCIWVGVNDGAGNTACQKVSCDSFGTDAVIYDERQVLDEVVDDAVPLILENDGDFATGSETDLATSAIIGGAAFLAVSQYAAEDGSGVP